MKFIRDKSSIPFTIIVSVILILTITLIITPISSVYWSNTENRVTTDSAFDRIPSITQTSDEKIWIVWVRNIYGNDTILCNVTSDYGETWSTEMNLTAHNDASQKGRPSILQTQDGPIWLVWSSDRSIPSPPQPHFVMDAHPESLTIQQGNSDTSTITVTSVNNFSEPVDLSVPLEPTGVTTTLNPAQVTPPLNQTVNSTLTVSANATATPGNYTLIVMGKSSSHSDNVQIALEITESSTVGHISNASHQTTQPSTASDGEDSEIYCKISNDYGDSWSNDIPLTDNFYSDQSPSILQADNGTIWLVWVSDRTGNSDVLYKTTSNSGASWSEEYQLTTDPNQDYWPSITQMRDGRIWVTWSSDRFGDPEIFYKIYNGSSWSGIMRFTIDTDIDTSPAIIQTINRKIWIFWTNTATSPSATADIYYKYSLDNGTSWSESVQFTTDPEEDIWPAVTQSNDLKMWVVWTSNRPTPDSPEGNYDIYYKTSLPGDVNEDGTVSILDLAIVAMAYGAFEGDPRYDMELDLNGDGIIDIRDLSFIGRNYGATD